MTLMARWPIGLLLVIGLAQVGGCDIIWRIDPVKPADATLAPDAPLGDVTFVEANTQGFASTSAMTIPLLLGNVEDGDATVVFVTWVGAGTVMDVSDGVDHYVSLGFPPMQGTRSLATYYHANLRAAAPYAVTVTFSQPVMYPDARILQYRGIVPMGIVDSARAATGHGTDLAGSVATTIDGDLVLAATHCQYGCTGGTGDQRGYLASTGNFAEELTHVPAGVITMTATQDQIGDWVLQLVAFKAK